MAVVNTKSAFITNRDATPQVFTDAAMFRQKVYGWMATLETVSGDDIASVYRFGEVKSSDTVRQLLLYCDDIGTAGAADFGLYQTAANGGAVVDADFFASAVDLSGGAINGTEITHESAVYGVEDIEKPLWVALGFTSDPGVKYDVCATVTTAPNAAGTVSLKCSLVE